MNLYVNRTNLGFEDCDDVEATQTLDLTAEDLKESGPPTQLKYVKYQRVKTLTIFIEDNHGGEVTCLGGLKLFGRVCTQFSENAVVSLYETLTPDTCHFSSLSLQPVDNVNMADFKKQPEH